MNTLPCMNCKTQIDPNDAKFYAETFLCTACFDYASHLDAEGRKRLNQLHLMLRENIRLALLEGRCFPAERKLSGKTELGKAEVLKAILELDQKREEKADAQRFKRDVR